MIAGTAGADWLADRSTMRLCLRRASAAGGGGANDFEPLFEVLAEWNAQLRDAGVTFKEPHP